MVDICDTPGCHNEGKVCYGRNKPGYCGKCGKPVRELKNLKTVKSKYDYEGVLEDDMET